MKTFAQLLTITATVVFFVNCTHKEKRQPANVQEAISENGMLAVGEILGGDSPLNAYRHPMRIQFHTNGDQKYLSETARKALNQALLDTLGTDNPEQGYAKLAAANITDQLIENFVKTLRVYKIINLGLQMDFVFSPTPHNPNSFQAELDSNQLVRLSELGSLSRKWSDTEKSTVTGSVYHNSGYIPKGSQDVDYIGGIISFYVEIMDTSPKLGLPNPKKNGVKGFARYRRYYRLNHEVGSGYKCEKYALTVKSSKSQTPAFYTVDLYKNFNLKNLIPTEETLEVFPGIVASQNEGRPELMPDTYEKSGKSISTRTFRVERKKSIRDIIGFDLKKIVYDIKTKKIDRQKSEVDLIEYSDSSSDYQNHWSEQQALEVAKQEFLKKCSHSMEKQLGLSSVLAGGLQ